MSARESSPICIARLSMGLASLVGGPGCHWCDLREAADHLLEREHV